jgi:putative membrane protein
MSRFTSNLLLAAAVAAVPLAGCATAEKATTTAQAAVQAQTNPTLSTTDADFIDTVARAGTEEVQFGELAEKRAGTRADRAFAAHMVQAHTALNQQLMQLAASKQITPPTSMDEMHTSMFSQLQGLHGRAFDRMYLNGQATDHQAVLQAFQNEAQNGTDPQVKAFAAQYAPEIQSHLTMVEKLGGHPAA